MKIQNLWNSYAVAWLLLLVTRPNNGSAGKTNEAEIIITPLQNFMKAVLMNLDF